MAKKKKSGKKQRKGNKTQVNFESMPPAQVAEKGDQWLAAGNAREAINAFKSLKKTNYEPEKLSPRLFQAYLIRYEQLMKKNMVKEAELVMDSAIEFLPTKENISLDVLKLGLRLLPIERGVSLYKKFISYREAVPKIERLLANRAVLEDGLHVLDILPPHLGLVCEKECLEQARVSMNAGRWDEAVKTLMPISRKSAFADIKIFAKLMDCFVNKDKPGIQKSLSMLDKDFPLTAVPVLLNKYVTGDGLPLAPDAVETATVLWGQSFLNETHAKNLKHGVSVNDPIKIKKAIAGLTAQVPLSDRKSAVEFLSETAGHGVMSVTKKESDVLNLYEKLSMPSPRSVFARLAAPRDNFLTDYTKLLWMELSLIFPDTVERNLAKAFILVKIAEKIINASIMEFDVKDHLNSLFAHIGFENKIYIENQDSRKEMHLVALALVEQALVLDPGNQNAYELMLKLSIDSPALRKALVTVLETMARTFPDDPRPLLRLAQIYSSKSAVRKAETALKEAFSRAPHDGNVLEQYALSHLFTANKNIKRNKFALAMRDLEAAEKMGVTSLGVHVAEKRLLCHLLETSKLSKKVFEDVTHGLSLAETSRVLALFKMDLEDPEFKGLDFPKELTSVLNDHKKRIPELTSLEIVSILKPVAPLHGVLYHSPQCFACFLDKQGTIFKGMTSRDFASIVLEIIEGETMEQIEDGAMAELMDIIIKELSQRIQGQKDGDDSIILKFIHVCLTHIWTHSGENKDFLSIIDSASSSLKEKLRTISRRIATIAPRPFRSAYEKFDFSLLEAPSFMGDFPFNIDSSVLDEFAKMMDKAMGGNMKEFMGGDDHYYDDDDDDDDDIDLEDLQAKKIFGSEIDPDKIYDLVYELVEEAQWVLEKRDMRYGLDKMDIEFACESFLEAFDNLLIYLREKGYHSFEYFRKAGKQFRQKVSHGREILLAFYAVKKKGQYKISKDINSFILGMKQGTK